MSETDAKAPATPPLSLSKKLLFSAVVFVIAIIALHIVSYFGIRFQHRRALRQGSEAFKTTIPRYFDYFDVRLDFVHPYLKMTPAPDQRLPFCRINHQGFRGPDFVREKTGAFRVAIVGGSAAMSWFANSETETIHACLKTELERAFPSERFEVYNFAVFQYNSTQELFLLETEALNYAPDFVIILSGINDFGWAITGVEKPWRPYYPLGWIHMRSIIDPSHFQEGWMQKPWLLRCAFKWSFLARTAWQNARSRCSPALFIRNMLPRAPATDQFFRYGEEEFQMIGERTRVWARNVEMMARLLESLGIPYCASLQPCAYYRREPSETEKKISMLFIHGEKDRENAIRYWTTVYPAAEQSLASRPFKIRILDMTSVFASVKETAFFDFCHYNTTGTQILARRYAEHLRPFVETWRKAKMDGTGVGPANSVSPPSPTL